MERSNDKRTRIIDAAIEVFCTQGYDAASMADVATKAGIAKGTLYLYFDSKQHLFEQTFAQCYEERFRRCCEGTDPDANVLDQLCMRLRRGMQWELEAPQKNRLVRIYLAHPLFRQTAVCAQTQEHWETIGQLMVRGLRTGELRTMPAQLLEELFSHFGSAVYYYIADHPQAVEDEQLWQNLRLSLRGCLCKD